jgi:hypothetical protein
MFKTTLIQRLGTSYLNMARRRSEKYEKKQFKKSSFLNQIEKNAERS